MNGSEFEIKKIGDEYSFIAKEKARLDPSGNEIPPTEVEFYRTSRLAILVDAADEVILMVCPYEEIRSVATAVAADYEDLEFSIDKVFFAFPSYLSEQELALVTSPLPYVKREFFKRIIDSSEVRISGVQPIRPLVEIVEKH